MQCCVASTGHVLVKEHVSQGNQPCFDLTTSVVFNRLQAENEFTFGDKRVVLDDVKLHLRKHRFVSEYEILFQAFSPSGLCEDCFICVENLRDVRNRLVPHQLLNVISVIQTGTSHNIVRFSGLSFAGRADGPCKFGSITGQPHVVLHALFLQLRDAFVTETTAVVHDVTSPALIIVSFARHGNKGTQSHCRASDSLTFRWRFFTVGVIAAALSLFFASLLKMMRRLAQKEQAVALLQLASRVSPDMRCGPGAGEDPLAQEKELIDHAFVRGQTQASSRRMSRRKPVRRKWTLKLRWRRTLPVSLLSRSLVLMRICLPT